MIWAHYFEVDPDAVSSIIKNDLAPLKEAMDRTYLK